MTAAVDHPSLDRLQNWFLAAITHPDGVRQGVASAAARRHIDVAEGGAESVLTRSRALPALDRLAVYGYAYFARLLDVLREEYPVLKKTLGDELFDAFAAEYLQKYPPRSYTLFDLGTRFPQFLRETRPTEESPDTGPDWPDFLIDLATWELAFNEVFDGPGTEDRAPLDVAGIAAVPSDRLPAARLVPAPCLRVHSLKYPVHAYFAAVRRNEDVPCPEPAETFLAITRQQYVVRHYELSKPAYVLLAALLDGKALGAAIGEVARHDNIAELEPRLTAWFSDWAARGFFLDIVARSDGDTRD
jgi:hypothetical protein